MGETSIDRTPLAWNRSIELDASDESVSAGALLMRETLEHSGIVSWLEENLIDDRRPGSVLHSTGNLLRKCLLLLCQGHRDQDDSDRLRHDPAIAAAAKSSGGPVPFDGGDGLPSQPTLSRFVDQLSSEENLHVLKQGNPVEWAAPDSGGERRVGGFSGDRCGRCAVSGGWPPAGQPVLRLCRAPLLLGSGCGFRRERGHPWRAAAAAGGGQGRGDLRLRAADRGRSA